VLLLNPIPLGIVSGFLGKDVATRTTLLMEKVMEEYADENLRILNEHELEEKELRRVSVSNLNPKLI